MREQNAKSNGHLPLTAITDAVIETTTVLEENGASVIDTRKSSRVPFREGIDALLESTKSLADEIAARPNRGEAVAPLADLEQMERIGLYSAPLPEKVGGLGLGTERGGHLSLLRLLAVLGGADLVLGRLYEGHVNALILLSRYGSTEQLEQAAEDVRRGCLFGVWNTGASEPLRLISKGNNTYVFEGKKTFASGAPFVLRPIVTAELQDRGWQMTLPRMDSRQVASLIQLDSSFWKPLGMEASESYGIDFTGASIAEAELIGTGGDFYREPLFRGGSIRFAAVHAGAIVRLHRMFTDWLLAKDRGGDPYQVARLGEVAMLAQQAILWVERAAAVAEEGFSESPSKLSAERMVECADMMRLAMERIANSVMQQVVTGIGAHGLLQPNRFERIIRDLTMYLRQPAPDFILAEVGRASLRKANLRRDQTEHGMWTANGRDSSLPPSYFCKIYERSDDPWDFQTSEYEAEKYQTTLDSLPKPRYKAALEVGCSIGVLTAKLAARADSVLGVDVSERALSSARNRCGSLPQVHFACLQVPREMPHGNFDLIVVSEVGYYWSEEEVQTAAKRLAQRQSAGDHLVLVHFTPPVADYPLSGDAVHELWLARPEWKSFKQVRREKYRLDLLVRQEDEI